MLLLFLAQAATAGMMATAVPPTRARPTFGALLSAADYPREAVRRGLQGNVVADLTITPAGRVSACTIVASSGHAILDDATCKILRVRAKFRPARDKQGRAVEDTLRTPAIEWRLSR